MLKRSLFLLSLLLPFTACSSIPSGKEGEAAEKLASEMLQAAGLPQWQKTAAVEFTFAGLRSHLYDKSRGLVQYRKGDTVVRFSKDSFRGIAYEKGKRIEDGRRVWSLIEEANSAFINDTFWLQPLFHIYSPGARRYLIEPDSLRVTFYEGGVTPGDSYIFTPGPDRKLQRMQMWVKILPVKGAVAEFSDYITTETGVPVALRRKTAIKEIVLTDVKFYASFPPAGQKDPFSDIVP
jgi:hypothetical protein